MGICFLVGSEEIKKRKMKKIIQFGVFSQVLDCGKDRSLNSSLKVASKTIS